MSSQTERSESTHDHSSAPPVERNEHGILKSRCCTASIEMATVDGDLGAKCAQCGVVLVDDYDGVSMLLGSGS